MRISVIGLGKLGCPMAAVLSSKGHQVTGTDANAGVIASLSVNKAPITETGLDQLLRQYPFKVTASFDQLVRASDTTFIVVPTPSERSGRFSSEYVLDAIGRLGEALRSKKRRHVIVISSTLMPGSCDGPVRKVLEEASGKTVGDEIGLCYSPEFIALGSVIENMLHPDMVLIGESDAVSGKRLEQIYRSVTDAPIRRMSLVNAEIAKISVNAYITMKISYANTLAEVCERVEGGDAYVVANAIGLDSRIGRKYLTPGTAYGGPCFPRDTVAFRKMANDLGVRAELAAATGKINERQTLRVARLVSEIAAPEGTVGILGLTYKPDTHITEESAGMKLAFILQDLGFVVRVFDPRVKEGESPFTHSNDALTLCSQASVVAVMTPWPSFKALVPMVFQSRHDLVVIDAWGIFEPGPWDDLHVVRLGVSA